MPNRRERAFYLTVSVFALTLTVAAGWAVVRNEQGSSLRNWLHSDRHAVSQPTQHTVDKISTPPQHPTKHKADSTQHVPSGQKAGSTSTPNKDTTSTSLVHVVPFGSNVSSQALNHTKQLLAQYDIAAWDGKRLQMTLQKPVKIELTGNKTEYESALQQLGVDSGQASSLTEDTGGFTIGSTIVIPLYQNTTDPDLLNSLAHELTHAYLNEAQLDLPSWLDEGLAVDDGMAMQRRSETRVAYMGYAKRMAEDVIKATKNGQLQPLSADESTVLASSTPYDVELQDWLAVQMLLQQGGYSPFQHYFALLKQGEQDPQAFNDSFQRTDTAVSQVLKRMLTDAANHPDNGGQFDLEVNSTVNGTLHVLPRNSQSWQGFQVPHGAVQFGLLANGTLTGINTKVTRSQDTQAPDTQTVYLDMEASGLTYQGHSVSGWGYAIDIHYGLYGFINSWVTLTNGKTIYLSSPNVLGVNLTAVQELGATNPILTLLQRDALAPS